MTTQQLTIRDVHIDAPGQHPGGGEWWITPRPDIPEALMDLGQAIFNGLGHERAEHWAQKFFEVAAPQIDLSGVWKEFATWLLREIALPAVHPSHDVMRNAVVAIADAIDSVARRAHLDVLRRAAIHAPHAPYKSILYDEKPYGALRASFSAVFALECETYLAATDAAEDAGANGVVAQAAAFRKMADKLIELIVIAAQVQP